MRFRAIEINIFICALRSHTLWSVDDCSHYASQSSVQSIFRYESIKFRSRYLNATQNAHTRKLFIYYLLSIKFYFIETRITAIYIFNTKKRILSPDTCALTHTAHTRHYTVTSINVQCIHNSLCGNVNKPPNNTSNCVVMVKRILELIDLGRKSCVNSDRFASIDCCLFRLFRPFALVGRIVARKWSILIRLTFHFHYANTILHSEYKCMRYLPQQNSRKKNQLKPTHSHIQSFWEYTSLVHYIHREKGSPFSIELVHTIFKLIYYVQMLSIPRCLFNIRSKICFTTCWICSAWGMRILESPKRQRTEKKLKLHRLHLASHTIPPKPKPYYNCVLCMERPFGNRDGYKSLFRN